MLCAIGYLVWMNGRILPGVSVAGQPLGGLTIPEAEHRLAQYATNAQNRKIVLNFHNRTLTAIPGAIGITTDIRATVEQAYQVGRSGPLLERLTDQWRVRRHGQSVTPVFKNNRTTLDTFFRYLEPGIAIAAVRSVVTLDTDDQLTFSDSRIGRRIVRDQLIRQLEQAVYHPAIYKLAIPVQSEMPALTQAQINYWQLNQILGSYTTQFNPTNADRTHNLELAVNAINNVLIYPGERFSFNDRVGPRVPASGYKEAPVVVMGKLVPGVGGGVCQVSTTLYNAVLMANLKVVRRINHSLPSAYAPLGHDATVAYDSIDFVFQNNQATPVLIVTRMIPPNLTIAILGRKSGWESVNLETTLMETYPYASKDIPDPGLPKGERVKASPGSQGYKVELWRTILFPDGSTKKLLENVSIYPPQPEEYKVGTKVDGKVEKAANANTIQ